MADETDSKKPAIPAWQIATPNGASDPSLNGPPEESSTQDRHALIEQAKAFLEEASVRGTSRDKKVAFLEKKGLQGEEIRKLLETASSEPAGSHPEDAAVRTIHDSSATSSPASAPPTSATSQPSTSTSETKAPSQSNREIPPIITYPEFLLRPTKPPPLITIERLSYALYTLAGISALTYGASRYLIQPMLQSLTSARHDLSSTALHNLEKLNEKLEGNVSHIPILSNSISLKKRERERHVDNDHDSDIGSIDSDPTELFHRDIATQTSPPPTPRRSSITRSSSTTTLSSSSASPPQTDALTTQSTRLSTLARSLSSLLATESPSPPSPSSSPSPTTNPTTLLLRSLASCQTYLDRLQFSMNAYSDYPLLYDASDLPAATTTTTTSQPDRDYEGAKPGRKRAKEENAEADEAMKFRQEIRAVKGALLSVRSFPVGRGAVGGGAR